MIVELKKVLRSSLALILLIPLPVYLQKPAADLIIINANVRTMDGKKPVAEALAVTGGKIIAVGSNKEIRPFSGPKTETIDAGGRLVLPGFNDSHVHFMSIGQMFSSIDLRQVRSSDEFVEKFRYYTNFISPGRWILGGYWDNTLWNPDSQAPTRELLDPATPENPVLVYKNGDPQTALANSAALKLAGFDKKTKTIPGGTIERDERGEATGIIRGEAIRYLRAFTPRLTTQNWREAAITATNYAAFYGVTSVQDVHSDDNTELFRQLEKEGKLKTRIYECITLPNRKKLIEAGIKRADGDAMLRRGCLKHFSDGDFGVVEDLYREVLEADRADLQVMIHAIGSRANEVVLTVYEKVLEENGPKDRRFRIEHAHRPRPEDLPRFAATKTIASMQPHLFFGGVYNSSEPYRSLLKQDTRLAFGSDSSITEIDPLLGIYAAVNFRRTESPGETLSVEEAVYAYTAGSAYAEFQENVKGTLTVGKLADIIILSKDIFSIDPEEIRSTKVLTTVVGGRIVYQAIK